MTRRIGTGRHSEAFAAPPLTLAEDAMPEQSESERKAWWRPRLDTIAACPACLPVVEGFARKIIKEQQDRGRWPEHDAADFVYRAARNALEGKVKRPQTHNEKRGAGRNSAPASRRPRRKARRACPNGCDPEAIRLLCKRIRNDCRSSTRTRESRDRKIAEMPVADQWGPGDRALARKDCASAIRRLPEKRRRAFIEIVLKGRDIEEYAAANDISPDTAEKHVKLAKRDLRAWLRDYRPDGRDGARP